MLTPGRLIDAEPSNDTPPIVTGTASFVAVVAEIALVADVAVAALPEVS